MAILYYGNGSCSVEGHNEIRGVQIEGRCKGVQIEKMTNDNFYIISNKERILIFPIGEGFLNELFYYSGSLSISSIMVVDNDGKKIGCTIKKVMDFAELINTKSEYMTTVSEDLKSNYSSRNRLKRKMKNSSIIENLEANGELLLSDGSHYSGYYHIHLKGGFSMTGAPHTEESKDLYYKQGDGYGNIIETLIPTKKPISSANLTRRLKKRRRREE